MRLLSLGLGGVMALLAQLAYKFLQEIGILIYFRIVPVNATILFIHHRAHYTAIDLGFIQQTMKGQRRDRTKMRRLNTLNLADQGRIIVLAADKQFRLGPELHDVRAGQH